jgi:hypothetical protein
VRRAAFAFVLLVSAAACGSRDAAPPPPSTAPETSAPPESPRPGRASLSFRGAFTKSIEGGGTSCGGRDFSVGSAEIDGPAARPSWSFNMFEQAPDAWSAGLAIDSEDPEALPTAYTWTGSPAAPHLEVSPTSAKVTLTLVGPQGAKVEVAGELRCPFFPSEPVPEAITALLARHAKTAVRPYSTFDFGRARYSGAASAIINGDALAVETKLRRLRRDLPAGWVAYLGTTRFLGDETWPDGSVELVVAPGSAPMDILRIARTDAVNYGLMTEALILALSEWDRAWGVDILHAETDTIELALTRMPKDLPAFARDVYELCPDAVDQGAGTIEALEREIASRRRVYLWWD